MNKQEQPTEAQIGGRHGYDASFRAKMSEIARGRVGSSSPNWKGGKNRLNSYGYVMEYDARLPLGGYGRFSPRYRRVMEEKIGRKLEKHETVHHINGVKDDDRLENLYLCTLSNHRQMHNEMSQIVMELYRKGLVTFDEGRYCFSQ